MPADSTTITEPNTQTTQPPTQQQPAVQTEHQRVADLRAELAAERVSKRDLETKISNAQREYETFKTEAEAQRTKAVETESGKGAKLRTKLIDAELRGKAAELGVADPDLLLHPLLDRTGIKVDDEGNVTGVAEALEGLKTKKPEWFKQTTTTTTTGVTTTAGGATATTAGGGATTTTTGAAAPAGGGATAVVHVSKMNKQQYEVFKAEQRKKLRAAG
jgi:hypothetical protein